MKGLWKCAKKGDTKEFATLLSRGDSFHDIDNNSRTPLHYAAEHGSIDIVKIILLRGGDAIVDLEDLKGETALEIAIQNGHEELAVMLVTPGGATLDSIFKKARRIAIPKRLELKLKEAEQQRQQSISESANIGGTKGHRGAAVMDISPTNAARVHQQIDDSIRQLSPSSASSVSGSGTLHRATPALPSFGRASVTANAAESYPERSASQQARVATINAVDSNTPSHASILPTTVMVTGNAVDLATLVLLATRVILAGLHEQYNATLLRELNEAANRFAQYLPATKEGLRVVSQNLREVGQFPVLGPMDVKRAKRVKEDYSALYDRIRPLQDSLRVLELDRRAHAPSLVHPPLLYLIGGAFSMFISIEQPYVTQLDGVVTSMSRAIRELSTTPSPAQFGQLAASFVNFLRCMAVRVLEVRTPSLGYEIVFLLLAISKAVRTLLLDSSNSAQLKIVVGNLKDIMVLVKSTLPSKLGKELLPAEESTLYKEASEQFAQTIDVVGRKPSRDQLPREQELVKSMANQLFKIQSGFREIHGNTIKNEQMKGGLGALGRGLLSDAQKLAADTGEVARLMAAKVASLPVDQQVEEWRDAKLAALEAMVLLGLMVELATACVAVRNRLSHHSHIPILLVLFSIASQFVFFPHM